MSNSLVILLQRRQPTSLFSRLVTLSPEPIILCKILSLNLNWLSYLLLFLLLRLLQASVSSSPWSRGSCQDVTDCGSRVGLCLWAGLETSSRRGFYPELGQAWWKKKAPAFLEICTESSAVIAFALLTAWSIFCLLFIAEWIWSVISSTKVIYVNSTRSNVCSFYEVKKCSVQNSNRLKLDGLWYLKYP